jgi:FAD:protein FMN transferase
MTAQSAVFEAIGTVWDIRIDEPIGGTAWAALLKTIRHRIAVFDKAYSRFRSDSLVMRISKKAGSYALPPDGFKLVRFYERLYQVTDGKVTPLIGQVMADAGYDATYSLKPKTLHRPPRWEDVISYDEKQITVTQPVLLDFGTAGKGYLVDIVGEILAQADIRSYLINAGGDLRRCSAGRQSIDVGLENPFNTAEVIGTVKVANRSLCASAGSKRSWGGFHHIIDPTILRSPEQVVATWVLADDTMVADGLATALFLRPASLLLSQFAFSYALLHRDMSLIYSREFPITIFKEET